MRTALLILVLPALACFPVEAQKSKKPSTGQRLSSVSTRFNPGNRKRTHNMRVAAKAINGATVKPGQTFSLNERIGKRTQARGYRTAIVFEDGKKVPGIGGGVSQITGTLFNAALKAGLPIVEFHNHSRPVPYLPVGRDATLAWGAKDLRFKNNSPSPIRLSCKVQGNRLIAAVYGQRKPGKQIRIGVGVQKLAKHHVVAKLYRKIKQNGKVIQTELVGTARYKWQPENAD